MTWDKALHNFFGSFGIPAFPVGAVEDDAQFPWLTYEKAIGRNVSTVVHLYYHTESESIPNEKAEEICSALREGGVRVDYDGGAIWITLGNPEWGDFTGDSELADGSTIKHRIINVTLDFPMCMR